MAQPSEPSNVEVGAQMSAVVGGGGSSVDVVGRKGGALFASTLTDLAMLNIIVNELQNAGALNPIPGEPGRTTVSEYTGANVDAHGRPGEFTNAMLGNLATLGLVATFFTLGTMNSGPSDEVKRQLQAEQEQKDAAIALSDAQKAEAIAKQDRDRAASLRAPKM